MLWITGTPSHALQSKSPFSLWLASTTATRMHHRAKSPQMRIVNWCESKKTATDRRKACTTAPNAQQQFLVMIWVTQLPLCAYSVPSKRHGLRRATPVMLCGTQPSSRLTCFFVTFWQTHVTSQHVNSDTK